MSSASALSPKRIASHEPSDLLTLLKKLGVPSELAAQAASSSSDKIYQTLQENPYSLCETLGASFFEIESYAIPLGFTKDHPQRLRAGLLFLLNQEESEGNCFSIRSSFLRRAARLLGLDSHRLSKIVQALEEEKRIIPHGDHLWTKSLSDLETEVARRILALCPAPEEETQEEVPLF